MRTLLLLLLSATLVLAGEPTPGSVVEDVDCKGAEGQSYACYLPKAYTKDKKWPILFCFDPGGQGQHPVRLYQDACERHGWIAVGSNNSRNGPIEPIRAAMTAIWTDVPARLSIDRSRLYATGFSGGSYVAMLFAHSRAETKFAGVFSVGAGLPRGLKTGPAKGDTLLSIGMVGAHDFARGGMMRMHEKFRDLGLRAHLWIFEGGHEWPPKAMAGAAVRRAELVARAGVEGSDLSMVAQEHKAAEALIADEKRWFDGYRRIKDLATLLAERDEGKALAERVTALEKAERFARESAADKALRTLGPPASYSVEALEASGKAWKKMLDEHKGTTGGERAGRLLGWVIQTSMEIADMTQRRDAKKAEAYRALVRRLEQN